VIKKALERFGMSPRGVACVVSVRGKRNEYEERYNSSQSRLRQLIMESYRRKPWSMTTDDWIGHIYKTTYSTKFCVCPDVRMEVGNMVDEFIGEVGMQRDESDKLKSTLLDAEKEVTKKASRR
jgi:sulfur relay (sulfurtransferase) DsrC/TusE family protein